MKMPLASPLPNKATKELISRIFWPLVLVLSHFFFSLLSDFLWIFDLVEVFSLLYALPVSSP